MKDIAIHCNQTQEKSNISTTSKTTTTSKPENSSDDDDDYEEEKDHSENVDVTSINRLSELQIGARGDDLTQMETFKKEFNAAKDSLSLFEQILKTFQSGDKDGETDEDIIKVSPLENTNLLIYFFCGKVVMV